MLYSYRFGYLAHQCRQRGVLRLAQNSNWRPLTMSTEPLLPLHARADGRLHNILQSISSKRSYHVDMRRIPPPDVVRSLRRTLADKTCNTSSWRGWLSRVKSEVKQMSVLWFIIYFGTFIPLFCCFMLPYYLGVDCVGWVNYFENKGYMEWTKSIGFDTAHTVQRVYNNDEFTLMKPAVWNGETTLKFDGSTANLLITTVLIWEVCKPFRYIFYLFLCRRTIKLCKRRNLFPTFFRKY